MTSQSPSQLADMADAVLDGTIPVPSGRATRLAGLIARQALEQMIDAQCATYVSAHSRPSMRSKLIVLREVGPDGFGDQSARAWEELSDACHHRAYEIAPSTAHTRELIALVRELAEESFRQHGNGL